MRKRYRSFNCWLADVDRALDHPAATVDESALGSLAYSFCAFDSQFLCDMDRLHKLVAVLKKLRAGNGSGRGLLKSGRRNSVIGTLRFCESYYLIQETSIPEDMEKLLLGQVRKTQRRSNGSPMKMGKEEANTAS